MKLPNFLKSKKNSSRASGNGVAGRTIIHRVARDPYVDWAIITTVSVLVGAALVILSIRTFLNMGSQTAPEAVGSAPSVVIDTKPLMTILGQYDDRATERAALLKGYNGPGDPSI
jgi:hypothetical protein